MKVDVEKLVSRIEEIYACGVREDGSHTRMAYSDEDVKARKLFTSYARNLGMQTRMDEAGNLILRMEGRNENLPAIQMGSHLDTVPDGGKYDGVLGCLAGLGVCEAYIEAGEKSEHPMEVIVFTDEEGFRFGKGLLGSSAICGQDPDVYESETDIYGNLRSEVMKSYGIKCKEIGKARRNPKDVRCFIELHIEQGAALDRREIPIGVVTSIAGVSRYDITVKGEANHAGSTAMADRKDALVAAASFISRVPEITKEWGNEFTVATVGTIKVTPHSVNVIPGTCSFSLEIRDQKEEVIRTIETKLRKCLEEICKESGEEYTFEQTSYHAPAPMTGWVKENIEKAVQELGYPHMDLPSGAFHDSLIMSSIFPTGMIFVPSVNGISHSRYELTRTEDIEMGCNVLLKAVQNIDKMK